MIGKRWTSPLKPEAVVEVDHSFHFFGQEHIGVERMLGSVIRLGLNAVPDTMHVLDELVIIVSAVPQSVAHQLRKRKSLPAPTAKALVIVSGSEGGAAS